MPTTVPKRADMTPRFREQLGWALVASALFFIMFLEISLVAQMFVHHDFPFGYWAGVTLVFAVTVAVSFAATATATRRSAFSHRGPWLFSSIAIGGAAWFVVSIVWLAPSPLTVQGIH